MAPPCKQTAESTSRVPDELLEDIFARMPAKSVQRCRCLSRAWAAALSSSGFIDRHLRLANRRDGSRGLFFLPDPDSGDDTTVHAWSPRRPLVAVRQDERFRRVAAVTRQCRGLVILEAKGENLHFAYNPARGHSCYTVDHYVYNPSTGQVTALPEGKEAHGVWPQNHAILGLGYDPSTRKHKVVRLYCRGELPPACEVYVLDSTGYWRPPSGATRTMPPAWATNYCTDQSVFAQGHVYWAAWPHKKYNGEQVVMSFSMVDEVFGILLPPGMDMVNWRISELGKRLCLFKDISAMRSYEVWILRDPLAGGWDLHCRINLDAASPAAKQLRCCPGVIPLDIVDDGNRVLLRPEPRYIRKEYLGAHQLVVYDPATGDVEDLLAVADGSIITHHTMTRRPAAPYEESVESTGLPHEDIIFSSMSSQVLAQVLRRLPARTLGRLKCLCRTWLAIIESGRFIRLHYEHPGRSSLARVVLFFMPYDWQFASLDSCLSNMKLACQMQQLQRRVVSSKPCHGLLLIANNNNYGAHVCNPVTGARVLHSNLTFDQPSDAATARLRCLGLGYDLSREEHVIVVLAYTSCNFDTGSYTMECSIRRLTDCVTKVAPSPPIPVTVDVPLVYAGGRMYWMGESRFSTGCSSILVFDICNEAFGVLPAPHSLDGSGRMLMAELTGQIRVVHICQNTETMTIWRKQELVTLNDGQEWTREHCIQLGQWPEFSLRTAARLVIPLAVDDAGRILLDTGRALGYYDPRNQTLETVYPTITNSLQLNYCPGFFLAVLCEDSLVRPNYRQRQYFGI